MSPCPRRCLHTPLSSAGAQLAALVWRQRMPRCAHPVPRGRQSRVARAWRPGVGTQAPEGGFFKGRGIGGKGERGKGRYPLSCVGLLEHGGQELAFKHLKVDF
eukprot:363565-Chlamydomonas_euryale.AAC.14